MPLSTSSYEFNPVTEGGFKFIAKPAEISMPFFSRVILSSFAGWALAALTVAVLSWIPLLRLLPGTLHMGITVIVFLFVTYKSYIIIGNWYIKNDKKNRGNGGSFTAGPKGVNLDNSFFIPRDRIHRLVLRNKVESVEIPYAPGMIIGGTGMIGASMAASSMIGNVLSNAAIANANAQRQKLTKISYCVDIEHSGISTTLAGGLTETTAYGLMTDVGRAIGIN